MDASTAIDAAVRACNASAALPDKERVVQDAEVAKGNARARQADLQDRLEDAEEDAAPALQQELCAADEAVREAITRLSTAKRQLRLARQQAEAGQGQAVSAAYGAYVDEHLARVRTELMARLETAALPEQVTAESLRACFEGLVGAGPESTRQSRSESPESFPNAQPQHMHEEVVLPQSQPMHEEVVLPQPALNSSPSDLLEEVVLPVPQPALNSSPLDLLQEVCERRRQLDLPAPLCGRGLTLFKE